LVQRAGQVQERQFDDGAKPVIAAHAPHLLGDVDGQEDAHEDRDDDAERAQEPARDVEMQDHGATMSGGGRRLNPENNPRLALARAINTIATTKAAKGCA
jgi:hypothetical protein